jgi:ATP-dependent Clp protease ATP-binding subunit ClpC
VFEIFTIEARRAAGRALDEGRRLGDRHLGTEHLLLALLDAGEPAGSLLRHAGVDRDRMTAQLTGGTRRAPRSRRRHTGAAVTESAQATFARSRDAAAAFGHAEVGTGHLLLGLLAGPDSTAHRLLASSGVAVDELYRRTAAEVARR